MSRKKDRKNKKGFSLIELMVAMFILMMVMGAMVAVSVAAFRSYAKSKAIKTVTEDVGFAMNSIVKDVRMGKVEKSYKIGSSIEYYPNSSSPQEYLAVTLNRNGQLNCYHEETDYLGLAVGTSSAPGLVAVCPVDDGSGDLYKKIVDLSETEMEFDATSGFYAMATSDDTVLPPNKIRGWAEINLNIDSPGMETDSIHVQSIVSSRDYGWEEVP